MIVVNQLEFAYPGNTQPTLKGISFSIQKGEIIGLLGPSGAGKSTVQKVLTGILKGYRGNVQVLGRNLQQWDASYYNHIGVGFELPNHYVKLTALENLRLFASFYDVPIQNPMLLLEKVGLQDDAHKKVESFSKGMKMRLNFIRALLHNPPVLFFDEPTSGLDPANARILKEIIRSLKNEGKTIVITTHHMHDAEELCDRVAFVVNGEIRLLASPKELKQQAGRGTVVVEYQNGSLNRKEFSLNGLGTNKEFLDLIRLYPVVAIHSSEASLEDIFMQVTGHRLS